MSLWTKVKEFFFPAPAGEFVPDYTGLSDARLRELEADAENLTGTAREVLHLELGRRGLKPVAAPPARRTTPRTVLLERPAGEVGNTVSVVPGLGVLLATTPGRWALVHLPLWDPQGLRLPETLELDALIVCNGDPRGWLSATEIARHARLAPDRIFALTDGPLDRSVGAAGGSATLLPDGAQIGWLLLERTGVGQALRARWSGAQADAAVGPLLEPLQTDRSILHVGSLAPPDGSRRWRMVLTAANATALTKLAGMPMGSSMDVIVLADAVGAHPRAHGFDTGYGVGVHLAGKPCPVFVDAVNALACVNAGRWELLPAELERPGVLVDLVEYLFVEGRLDDAARLLELRPDDTLAGTLLALRGDLDGAAAAYTRAEAFAELALLCASRGDREAAIRHARAAADESDDWGVVPVICRALWLAGAADEANAVLAKLGRGIKASLVIPVEELLEEDPPKAPVALAFPELAGRARRLGLKDRAEKLDARNTGAAAG